MADQRILTINTGSSSLKLLVLTTASSGEDWQQIFQVSVTGIGQSVVELKTQKANEAPQTQPIDAASHAAALQLSLQKISEVLPLNSVNVVGHRIVHGGPQHFSPELISPTLEKELRELMDLDPEHMPAALAVVDATRHQLPDVPQLACFDTGFFENLPSLAQIISLPRSYQKAGVRRYGFHGLSYSYIAKRLHAISESEANGRVIMAHLGSGASLAALQAGKPVDTTMSFSPTSGLVMSTRSGDLDPTLASYLHKTVGLSLDKFTELVTLESGLLGVSGTSADMYTLLQQESSNTQVKEAVGLFCYQVGKSIGALSAVLGGLDVLVFSGGIGEQSPIIRERICKNLGYLGVSLDNTLNQQSAGVISKTQEAPVTVRVIPTNEAQTIAELTAAWLAKQEPVTQ